MHLSTSQPQKTPGLIKKRSMTSSLMSQKTLQHMKKTWGCLKLKLVWRVFEIDSLAAFCITGRVWSPECTIVVHQLWATVAQSWFLATVTATVTKCRGLDISNISNTLRVSSPRDGTVLNYRLMLRGLNFPRRMCVYNVCLIISLRPPNLLTLTCSVVPCSGVPRSIWNWSFQLSGSCAQFFSPTCLFSLGESILVLCSYECGLVIFK